MFWPEPNAGPVIENKTRPLRLFLRHSRPVTAPDGLNPILAHRHATVVEHGRHPAVAVAAIVRCNQNNVPCQFILVGLQRWYVFLRPTWLPENPAGCASAQVISILRSINSLLAPLGAYKSPSAIFFGTCFSSDRSAPNSLAGCRNVLALTLKHLDLPQFRDDLFGSQPRLLRRLSTFLAIVSKFAWFRKWSSPKVAVNSTWLG